MHLRLPPHVGQSSCCPWPTLLIGLLFSIWANWDSFFGGASFFSFSFFGDTETVSTKVLEGALAVMNATTINVSNSVHPTNECLPIALILSLSDSGTIYSSTLLSCGTRCVIQITCPHLIVEVHCINLNVPSAVSYKMHM